MATYGFVIFEGGRIIEEGCGRAEGFTSNMAEYSGLLRGLEKARALKLRDIEVRGDSKLVIFQMRGAWRVKDRKLGPMWLAAREIADEIGVKLRWVPREQNRKADALTNRAARELDP